MVLILIAGSTVLGHFIAVTKIPMVAADWIVGLPFPTWFIMILITFVYLIGGSFIDDLAFMILATPIFYPAIAKLGYNPLWFGIMIGVTVMVGVVIPPVAINVLSSSRSRRRPLASSTQVSIPSSSVSWSPRSCSLYSPALQHGCRVC